MTTRVGAQTDGFVFGRRRSVGTPQVSTRNAPSFLRIFFFETEEKEIGFLCVALSEFS